MLAINGVAPVSEGAAKYCSEKSGRKGVGLWAFVASLRAEKKCRAKERKHKEGPSEAGDGSVARQRGSKCSSTQGPTQPGETVATQP